MNGVILAALAAMILVPAAALDDPRPARLGWHMYAAAVDLPEIDVVFADGSREERNIGNIASGFRPEVDYFDTVARFICASEPSISSVHMTRQRPDRQAVIECAQF